MVLDSPVWFNAVSSQMRLVSLPISRELGGGGFNFEVQHLT